MNYEAVEILKALPQEEQLSRCQWQLKQSIEEIKILREENNTLKYERDSDKKRINQLQQRVFQQETKAREERETLLKELFELRQFKEYHMTKHIGRNFNNALGESQGSAAYTKIDKSSASNNVNSYKLQSPSQREEKPVEQNQNFIPIENLDDELEKGVNKTSQFLKGVSSITFASKNFVQSSNNNFQRDDKGYCQNIGSPVQSPQRQYLLQHQNQSSSPFSPQIVKNQTIVSPYSLVSDQASCQQDRMDDLEETKADTKTLSSMQQFNKQISFDNQQYLDSSKSLTQKSLQGGILSQQQMRGSGKDTQVQRSPLQNNTAWNLPTHDEVEQYVSYQSLNSKTKRRIFQQQKSGKELIQQLAPVCSEKQLSSSNADQPPLIQREYNSKERGQYHEHNMYYPVKEQRNFSSNDQIRHNQLKIRSSDLLAEEKGQNSKYPPKNDQNRPLEERFGLKASNQQVRGSNPNSKLEEFVSQYNLIENYYIISANQQQLIKSNFQDDSEIYVQPEIIYSYSPNHKVDGQDIEPTIMQLAFPVGVFAKKRVKTNSMSDLMQIVSQDKGKDISQNGFVFTLKTEKSYQKMDNSKSERGNSFNRSYQTSKTKDIVDQLNPNKMLYCICISQHSFMHNLQQEDTNLKKNKKNEPGLKREYFFEVESVYIILTRLPDIIFFLNVLENINNMIKLEKLGRFGFNQSTQDLDIFFFKKVIDLMEGKLESLAQTKIPLPQKSFTLKSLPNDLKSANLIMEPLKDFIHLQNNWGMVECLRRFRNFSDLINIYASIILEHSIVFVSESKTLLSQFILYFLSLLQPLKWPHPIIFALPEVLQELLYSPTPIIIGINQTKYEIEQVRFSEQYPEFNIIYLDDMTFTIQEDSSITDSQFIRRIEKKVEPLYKKFQDFLGSEALKQFEEQTDLRRFGRSILSGIKDEFSHQIIDLLPNEPIFSRGNQFHLDFAQIQSELFKTKQYPDTFIAKLFKTQNFSYFLEEYYGIA